LFFVLTRGGLIIFCAAELAEEGKDPFKVGSTVLNNEEGPASISFSNFCSFYFHGTQHACEKHENLHHANVSRYTISANINL